MKTHPTIAETIALMFLLTLFISACNPSTTILNVSYDPTREFFTEYNLIFARQWKQEHQEAILVSQSHGGSGKQARSVIDGIPADIVTLALAHDIDAIAQSGLTDKAWQSRLPFNSAPYTSTIVFVVRKGNPKKIYSWDDLIRDDIRVVMPNPITSGGARLAYLAAWGHAKLTRQGDQKAIRDYMRALYANVPILDTSARASAMSFVERGQGDVLLAWENEALLLMRYHSQEVDIITPPYSILAEPVVAVIDRVVNRRGTRAIAEAYLQGLYTEEAQEAAARHYYRPRSQAVLERYRHQFAELRLFTLEEMFGTWESVHRTHFAPNGEFEKILKTNSLADSRDLRR